MDPITHGIGGALLGKGYFSERHGRVATFAVILGSIFPDVDIFPEPFLHDPMALIKIHRGFTHSFIGLPLFSVALAWGTRKIALRRGYRPPSLLVLTLACAVGMASHLLLDAMTTYGTRLLNPFSTKRYAWDLLFIVDAVFTAILLLPQVTAWVASDVQKAKRCAALMWTVFSLCALGVWKLATALGFGFRFVILGPVVALLALVFFLPATQPWGRRISRASWCRAGVYAALAYIFACGVAHRAGLERTRRFAEANHLEVVNLGALPLPPSFFDWDGLIRATDGVYESRLDVRDSAPPEFLFYADSPHMGEVARALGVPDVQVFLWFARFPLIRTTPDDGDVAVDFRDMRFFGRRRQNQTPFTFRVVFDSRGQLVKEGWLADGILRRRVRIFPPEREGEAK